MSPKARMHLSMDNVGMVDDGCLDNYDMGKAAGSSIGGRVHSIDVILGFAKDQEPLLHSVADDDGQKSKNMGNPPHPEKQVPSNTYGHIPELDDSSQKSSYHSESPECNSRTQFSDQGTFSGHRLIKLMMMRSTVRFDRSTLTCQYGLFTLSNSVSLMYIVLENQHPKTQHNIYY